MLVHAINHKPLYGPQERIGNEQLKKGNYLLLTKPPHNLTHLAQRKKALKTHWHKDTRY